MSIKWSLTPHPGPPRLAGEGEFVFRLQAKSSVGERWQQHNFRTVEPMSIFRQTLMKTLTILFVSAALLAGCVSPPPGTDFFQSGIRMTPPVLNGFLSHDNGGRRNRRGTITDPKGDNFPVFVDHRLGTETPGAIYLMAYPRPVGERSDTK